VLRTTSSLIGGVDRSSGSSCCYGPGGRMVQVGVGEVLLVMCPAVADDVE
jgi:hypothetical protein